MAYVVFRRVAATEFLLVHRPLGMKCNAATADMFALSLNICYLDKGQLHPLGRHLARANLWWVYCVSCNFPRTRDKTISLIQIFWRYFKTILKERLIHAIHKTCACANRWIHNRDLTWGCRRILKVYRTPAVCLHDDTLKLFLALRVQNVV